MLVCCHNIATTIKFKRVTFSTIILIANITMEWIILLKTGQAVQRACSKGNDTSKDSGSSPVYNQGSPLPIKRFLRSLIASNC